MRYLAVIFILCLSACGPAGSEINIHSSVLGHDDRVSVDLRLFPWSAVGRLNLQFADGSHSFCTATLVARQWIVTAAHCIHKQGLLATRMDFLTQYAYGSFGRKARVIAQEFGSSDPRQHWSEDWALLKLDQDLGTEFGFLEFHKGALPLPASVDLPGYSHDPVTGESLSAHLACQLTQLWGQKRSPFPEMNRTLDHDCDLEPGASGAPLLVWEEHKPVIVAIQSYHWSQSRARQGNGAVPSEAAAMSFSQL